MVAIFTTVTPTSANIWKRVPIFEISRKLAWTFSLTVKTQRIKMKSIPTFYGPIAVRNISLRIVKKRPRFAQAPNSKLWFFLSHCLFYVLKTIHTNFYTNRLTGTLFFRHIIFLCFWLLGDSKMGVYQLIHLSRTLNHWAKALLRFIVVFFVIKTISIFGIYPF